MDMIKHDKHAWRTAVPDVSIVMPCLNEIIALPHCIRNAQDTLARIAYEYGLAGEIIIADNGSTDGSQALATSLGARVVAVEAKGYGAALIGGCHGARGRFILMGDCDGSYDFTNGVAMVGKLIEGSALCMGSRFDGGIAPGAMPWKNRYIGNPVLTGILNIFFRTGINDAHCGLRAIRKESFLRLNLSGSGMEFASEMVIKAALLKLPISQVPAPLSPDLRQRAPHLRPWRDGWRHLRYLLMLAPNWLFGVPALAAIMTALTLLCIATLYNFGILSGTVHLGTSWTILAGFLLTVGHLALIMALATHVHGVNCGYRSLHPLVRKMDCFLTLETALCGGLALVILSGIGLAIIGVQWASSGFTALPSVLPITLSAAFGALGIQTMFGGFLLAVLSNNDAQFLKEKRLEVHDETRTAHVLHMT